MRACTTQALGRLKDPVLRRGFLNAACIPHAARRTGTLHFATLPFDFYCHGLLTACLTPSMRGYNADCVVQWRDALRSTA
jgi:hypothetical protein